MGSDSDKNKMNALSNRHAALLAAVDTIASLASVERTPNEEPAAYVIGCAEQYLAFLEGVNPPKPAPAQAHLALVA